MKGGVELPIYRGDIINELDFTPEARMPNPKKMLQAYTQSAATLNLLRAFSKGGFADMHQVHAWTLGFTDRDEAEKYRDIANRIQDTLDFMAAAGIDGRRRASCATVDFYTSHEALLLEYEEALTRVDSTSGQMGRGLGPHDLDRRPHAPAGRRACRILPRRAEPDRPQVRAVDHGRGPQGPDGEAEPRRTRRAGSR